METNQELVEALIQRQAKLDLSDGEMAVRLNVSRDLWNKVRRGEKAIGSKLLRGIMREFPDLAPEVLSFLRRNREGRVMSCPYCGNGRELCHKCGLPLRRVLDGEMWCDNCGRYQRSFYHGWVYGQEMDDQLKPRKPAQADA